MDSISILLKSVCGIVYFNRCYPIIGKFKLIDEELTALSLQFIAVKTNGGDIFTGCYNP